MSFLKKDGFKTETKPVSIDFSASLDKRNCENFQSVRKAMPILVPLEELGRFYAPQ